LFDVSPWLTQLTWTEDVEQVAASATLTLSNNDGEMGARMNRPGTVLFVETRADNEEFKERLRLLAWDTTVTDTTQGTLEVTAYDHLIYLQQVVSSFSYTADADHPGGWRCHEIVADIIKKYRVPVKMIAHTQKVAARYAHGPKKGKVVRDKHGRIRYRHIKSMQPAIPKGKYRIPRFVVTKATLYEAISLAYYLESVHTSKHKDAYGQVLRGENYYISSSSGQLVIHPSARRPLILTVEDRVNLRSASFGRSLSDGIGQIVIPRGTTFDEYGNPKTTGTTSSLKSVTLFGDSISVMSKSALKRAMPGITIYAQSSKHLALDADSTHGGDSGLTLLDAHRSTLKNTVVMALGTNDDTSAHTFGTQIDSAMDIIGRSREAVWVTTTNQSAANEAMRAAKSRHPNLQIADWKAVAKTGSDHVHPTASGQTAFARVIARAVTRESSPSTTTSAKATPKAQRQSASARSRIYAHNRGETPVKSAAEKKVEARSASSMLFGQISYNGRGATFSVRDDDWSRAEAELFVDRMSRAKKTLTLQADGNVHVRKGDRIFVVVPFSNGPRYRKEVFVSAVTHSLAAGEHVMDITCAWRETEVANTADTSLLEKKADSSSSDSSSGKLDTSGLHKGIVVGPAIATWFGGPRDPEDYGSGRASGLPESLPGCSIRPGASVESGRPYLKGWWLIEAPNGKEVILQQTDLGPGAPPPIDIVYSAVGYFGYTEANFPGGAGSAPRWKATFVGHSKPPGAKP
jgi:hypothetical protein